MAQDINIATGQKRSFDDDISGATPAAKKRKLSTAAPSTVAIPATPATEKRSKLPYKVADNKPIPTLPQPQSADLADSEYLSVAASEVLQTSLARSQARWTHEGLFEKYWVKPETGKNARAPPPNNPDIKWMKYKGECRIRVEPHIFECQMFVEDRPRAPPPLKQYATPIQAQSVYGQPYRPQQYYASAHQQPYQNQALPPLRQHIQQHPNTLPPINNMTQRPPSVVPAPVSRSSTPLAQPGKKPNPDPVITKLAGRASSDPELKTLMKEVATGNATPEQLKVFQRHIDDLQAQISKEKEERDRVDEEQRRRDAEAAAQIQVEDEVIQYDGAGDSRTSTPTSVTYHTPVPYQAPAPLYAMAQQQASIPSPTHNAVILAFATPGASEDRFLFPQYSILESISSNHHLASFIVTRKGRDAADPTGLDPDKEYWQPVTIMLEVKLGLEDLPGHVKRWVKPADEVRAHMEAIMKRCERAPETFVAMRLPSKSSTVAETESNVASKEATPAILIDERAAKPKSNVKYVKKAPKSTPAGTPTATGKRQGGPTKSSAGAMKSALATPAAAKAVIGTDGATDEPENGRPKRAVRKSHATRFDGLKSPTNHHNPAYAQRERPTHPPQSQDNVRLSVLALPPLAH
ncbi:hypothetical protein LTR22_019167 [Elasticomyces elasticus]|nr:hypothetical protein LTR22_019167 [Elasticomyces elasticus]KAK4911602.1 hypothetical protein LTR49_019852 [Elasticomyces elasticus]KAK5765627.1 hypothetical protein LTS12_004131 [Elasticomyces elasticus]